jgi:hypothetical protein
MATEPPKIWAALPVIDAMFTSRTKRIGNHIRAILRMESRQYWKLNAPAKSLAKPPANPASSAVDCRPDIRCQPYGGS